MILGENPRLANASLHDYFFGQALQGVLAGVMVVNRPGRSRAQSAAHIAYSIADAAMELRNERLESTEVLLE